MCSVEEKVTIETPLVGGAFVDAILTLMPGMREKLTRGAVVLDAGCGRGHILSVMARMFPRSVFRGYDVSPEAIAAARELADDRGIRNVDFEVIDVRRLFDEPEEYDLITAFNAIHGQAAPMAVVGNLARSLKLGGNFLLQEMWGQERVRQLVSAAGFTRYRFERLPADPLNYFCVASLL